MNIVSVFGKGGVGKSTTSFILADFLSRSKGKVLVIDLDKQNTLSSALLGREKVTQIKQEKKKSFNTYLNKTLQQGGLNAQGFTHRLENRHQVIDVMLIDGEQSIETDEKLERLSGENLTILVNRIKKDLESQGFNLVIIDAAPNIDIRNQTSMIGHLLSDITIIPCELSNFDTDALHDVFATIEGIGKHFETKINMGLMINKVYRQDINNEVLASVKSLAAQHGVHILRSMLPYSKLLKLGVKKSESLRQCYGATFPFVQSLVVEIPKLVNRVKKGKKSINTKKTAQVAESTPTPSKAKKPLSMQQVISNSIHQNRSAL